MIPLGDYLPDAPAYGSHATVANNCLPFEGYYGPFKSLVAYTPASTEAALGAFSAKSQANLPYNFIGGATKLQKITSAAWEDVTRASPYTNASADKQWEFTTFGDRVIATNYNDVPQSYIMGTSVDFVDLTTLLKASTVATVRGFVMFGNTTEAAVNYPNRVKWSALENPTDYVPSVSTQSDKQDLFGDSTGRVMKIVGGEYATIFMENGIFRGTYVGGKVIFTFDQIVRGTGTLAAGSVASYGDMIFFLGNDGFYQMSSSGLMPIGEGSVNRDFFNDVYSGEYWRISSMIDPKNSLYIIAYPVATGFLQRLLIYNWVAKKWSTVEPVAIESLFTFFSEFLSADSAAALALIGSPDTGPYASTSADSDIFKGGLKSLGGIDSTHAAGTFTGSALAAVVETAETQITPERKSVVRMITPLIEGTGGNSGVTVQIGARDSPQDAVTYSSAATMNAQGEAMMFSRARYHRARITITGGFTKAYGINVKAATVGKY